MTEQTITFTPSASLRKGLKLIAKGIWLTIGSIGRLLDTCIRRFPYVWIVTILIASVIIAHVNIGKARAERDRLNKQNYELTQKVEKYLMENSLENKDCNIKADMRKPKKKVLNVSTSSQLSQARFTRRRQHTELIEKRINYQNACDSVGCLLFLVNDQAGFAIFDAMDRLKRSPLYKQKVKQLANKASKAYDLYEKTRRSMFLNKDVEELNYILQDKYQDWL